MDKKEQLKSKVAKIDELVAYFENSSEDFDLEEGLEKYEKALALVKEVKEQMEKFELKIKAIEDKYLNPED
ncbi:MAG TPA: exodeoxyribonuclease VII small subunit [Candidatus Dojkabacteria bacterium]|jgi:exonuclease VII small subunit|nr:exodeoxyribonuclease VII small subunit [Candidatus Dojkabacteria bacterium]